MPVHNWWCTTLKRLWGCRNVSPCIIELGGRSGSHYASCATGEGAPPYPLHRISSECGGGEKNISSCQEVDPYSSSVHLRHYINGAVPAARELKYSMEWVSKVALPKYLIGHHLWNIHMLSVKNCICFAVNSCREGHDQFWRRDFYFIPVCHTYDKCKLFSMDYT